MIFIISGEKPQKPTPYYCIFSGIWAKLTKMAIELIEQTHRIIADYIIGLHPVELITWCLFLVYVGVYILAVIVSKVTFEGAVPRGVVTSWGREDPVTIRERMHMISSSVVSFCSNGLVIGIALTLLLFVLTPFFTSITGQSTP